MQFLVSRTTFFQRIKLCGSVFCDLLLAFWRLMLLLWQLAGVRVNANGGVRLPLVLLFRYRGREVLDPAAVQDVVGPSGGALVA
jgi:hypothetical protein